MALERGATKGNAGRPAETLGVPESGRGHPVLPPLQASGPQGTPVLAACSLSQRGVRESAVPCMWGMFLQLTG